MKIISWNVNGINAAIKKGALNFIEKEDSEIICLQEVRSGDNSIDKKIFDLKNYKIFWNKAQKKGYSGTMVLTRQPVLSESQGIGIEEFDKEGRVQSLEFEDFYLVNAYVVNAQRGLKRLEYKLRWNQQFLKHCNSLKMKKPVIICGDFNVAHEEIDLKNPKSNKKNAGFSKEERESFTELLDNGYIDTFRIFNKDPDNYTWWSYRNNARARNIGWRIDYFVVSKNLVNRVEKSEILDNVIGSDHCPIRLTLND